MLKFFHDTICLGAFTAFDILPRIQKLSYCDCAPVALA